MWPKGSEARHRSYSDKRHLTSSVVVEVALARQSSVMKAQPIYAFVAIPIVLLTTSAPAADITLTRLPDGGLQPQAALGADGTTHLVYFQGEPKAGDLFYARRPPGATEFQPAIRVNSQPGAAIAIGTIRGPQLALGKNDRVHVAWNGSGNATAHDGAPMLYSRLNDDGNAFESQRDLMTFTSALDGGGSVAVDQQGNVYVAWHGQADAKTHDETARAVFVAVSTDEGKTFARERQANTEPSGACGCCGMKAYAPADGSLYLLYREARRGLERGATILASHDHAASFTAIYTHPWTITTCPMSSAWLGPGRDQTLAAWETAGHVWFARVSPRSDDVEKPLTPRLGAGAQKHPVAVQNASGETLLVWTEGTGWMKGGAVAWQLYDTAGKPTNTAGRRKGVPTWSLATAIAHPNGSFEIIY
jgi:hypothetical protein